MTRELHKDDVLKRADRSLVDVVTDHASGQVLVVAPDDERIRPHLPASGTAQATFGGGSPTFPTVYDYSIGALDRFDNRDYPITNEEYDTVISLFALCPPLDRAIFQPIAEVARPGGTVMSVAGVRPKAEADCDFKGWWPASECVALEELIVTRTAEYQTPKTVAVYERTTAEGLITISQ